MNKTFSQLNKKNIGIDTSKELPGFDSADSYYEENHVANTMQEPLARWIIDRYPNAKTILDVGCAAGALGYFLRKLKPELIVIDLDGNPETANSPFVKEGHHFIVRTDEPYNIVDENGKTVKFDLIVSFEHLEHIQLETFDAFAENIEDHSKEGTLFFATAALYGFPARPHVHCHVKPAGEWDRYFQGRGWKHQTSPVLTRAFKSEPWDSRMAGSHEVKYEVKPSE